MDGQEDDNDDHHGLENDHIDISIITLHTVTTKVVWLHVIFKGTDRLVVKRCIEIL